MTPPFSDIELAQRLILAALLGAILGFEREVRHKSAGLRTNILISVGAALFTLMSLELGDGRTGDPGRIAAQVVTGVGFLGAGAIMRTDAGIHGLTTAATVWVNAAVGVTVGGGEYHLAIIATAVTLAALLLLHPLERIIDRRTASSRPEATGANDTDGSGQAPTGAPAPENGSTQQRG